MKTKKLLVAMVLILLTVGMVFAAGQTDKGAAQKQFSLRLGHDQSSGHPFDLGAKRFAENVEKATNGNVKITIYPSSQLGDSSEQIEGLKMGTLDMAVAAFSHVASFVPELDLFGAPFLFVDEEHFTNVFTGEVGDLLDKASQDRYGIHLLSTFTSGYRLLFNNKRLVEDSEDLAGMKIRVMGGEANALTWSVFGALPTPMPYSEVYSALQAGVIDGAENEPVSVLMNRFYENAPYFAMTRHLVTPLGLFISGATYKKLPAEYQQIVKEEAVKAAEWEMEYITAENMKAIAEMEKMGVKVSYPDVSVFQAEGRKIQDQVAKKLNLTDLLEKVRAAE